MTLPDIVNGIFEAGLSIFLARGVLMLRADKVVKGFWWPTVAWTTAWGLWNLFYYPHLGQWASFIGGVAVVLVNLTWLAHVAYYSKGDMTWHRVLFGGTDRSDERRKFVSAVYRRDRQNKKLARPPTMLRSLSEAARRFLFARMR